MSFCRWFKRGRINKYKFDLNMEKKVIAGESTWFHSSRMKHLLFILLWWLNSVKFVAFQIPPEENSNFPVFPWSFSSLKNDHWGTSNSCSRWHTVNPIMRCNILTEAHSKNTGPYFHLQIARNRRWVSEANPASGSWKPMQVCSPIK